MLPHLKALTIFLFPLGTITSITAMDEEKLEIKPPHSAPPLPVTKIEDTIAPNSNPCDMVPIFGYIHRVFSRTFACANPDLTDQQ